MAYSAADLDTIRAAIASGTRKVTFADGKSHEYQDLSQLLAAEKVIAASVEIAAAAMSGLVRRKFASFRSGC